MSGPVLGIVLPLVSLASLCIALFLLVSVLAVPRLRFGQVRKQIVLLLGLGIPGLLWVLVGLRFDLGLELYLFVTSVLLAGNIAVWIYGLVHLPGRLRSRTARSQDEKPIPRPSEIPAEYPIFLSDRRDDSAAVVGRLYDQRRSHFGDEAVFKDLDSIPLGVDYRKYLDEKIRALADRQGTQLRDDPGFHHDAEILINGIQHHLARESSS